jgi:hypothetical protein
MTWRLQNGFVTPALPLYLLEDTSLSTARVFVLPPFICLLQSGSFGAQIVADCAVRFP